MPTTGANRSSLTELRADVRKPKSPRPGVDTAEPGLERLRKNVLKPGWAHSTTGREETLPAQDRPKAETETSDLEGCLEGTGKPR